MRILPVIVIFLMLAVSLSAQVRNNNDAPGGPEMAQGDSVKGKAEKVNSEIRVWTLSDQYSTVAPIEPDTATLNFHNYNPIFKKSISNSYLGYLGAPYQSNIFFDREVIPEYYFIKNFNHYFTSQQEVEYYNTTTPFAILKYQEGMPSDQYEQMFTAFFTRNIDPVTNFGFTYDAHKSIGQYLYQESLHEHLNIFFSRNSERYNGYASLMTGTNMVVENGGLAVDSVHPYRSPDYYPPRLNKGIEVNIKNFSFFTSHEYLLGSLPSFFKKKPAVETDTLQLEVDTVFVMADSIAVLADSTGVKADSTNFKRDKGNDKKFEPAYSIQYSIEYSSFNRYFDESVISQSFFDTTYISKISPYSDSSIFNTFTQILQLKAFENPNRKFTFGKRAFIENEIVEAAHPVPYGQARYNYSNLYVGGEIYRREGNFWNWNALARVAILGRNVGDAMLKGSIHKPLRIFNDTTHVIAEGWYSDKKAPIFLEHWQGNHFKWDNHFKKQHEIIIKGMISYPRFKLQTGVNYAMLANYVYFNEEAVPDQYEKEFSVFSIWVDKDFHIGPFCWSNKIVWQEVSDNTVMHLPPINIYSSATFSGVLFKVMKYQLGAEIYYHSPYYGESYQPATSSFYLQNETVIGGFPYVNVFLNAKLKRTSAFVIYQHANSWISDGRYFGSVDYPLNPASLRFGFLWSFYD